MRIIGVIPARYQSSRFPGKPLADILGRPMIWWVYQQCLKVPELDEVYVATEDSRIEAACRQYGMNVLMTSDKHPTGSDRVGEAAQKIEGDLFINIQGDEPLIDPGAIRAVIETHQTDPEIAVVNTMTMITNDDDLARDTVVKVAFDNKGDVVYLSRSVVPYLKDRSKKVDYYRHMGLYGLTKEALRFFARTARGRIEMTEDIEMFRFIENRIPIRIIAVETGATGVDCPEDIQTIIEQMGGVNG